MAKVNISINGRRYALGCDDGEEIRLQTLGQKLDKRVKELANQFGQIGDLRLLVMAGISMLDEFEDTDSQVEEKAKTLIANIRETSENAIQMARQSEADAAESLTEAANRIEAIARKLSALD